jgi:putative Ca2+/H+ antiporter (TMEM165/GDT1 family)
MNSRATMSSVRDRAALVDRPLFWSVASAIFLANTVLSALHGQWALVALQASTALLAAVAAFAAPAVKRSSKDDAESRT